MSSPRDDTVPIWRRQDGHKRGRQSQGTTGFPYGNDRTGTTGDDRGRQGTTGDDRGCRPGGRERTTGAPALVVPCRPGDDSPYRPLLSPSCRPVTQESPQKGQSPGTGKCEKKTPTSDSAQPRPLTPRFKVVGRVVVQNFSGSNAGPRWRCRSTLN